MENQEIKLNDAVVYLANMAALAPADKQRHVMAEKCLEVVVKAVEELQALKAEKAQPKSE